MMNWRQSILREELQYLKLNTREVFYSALYYYENRIVWLDLMVENVLYYFFYHGSMVVYLEVV
jgi:hypothetical protein